MSTHFDPAADMARPFRGMANAILTVRPGTPAGPQEIPMERFGQDAQMVLRQARAAAERASAPRLTTAHLLKGLAEHPSLWRTDELARDAQAIRGTAIGTTYEQDPPAPVTFRAMLLTAEAFRVLTIAANSRAMSEKAEGIDLAGALANAPTCDAKDLYRLATRRAEPWNVMRSALAQAAYDEFEQETAARQAAQAEAEAAAARGQVAANKQEQRLAAVLYRLMRDDVPFGKLAEALQEVERAQDHRGVVSFNFEGPMGEVALDFARRLLK